MRLETLCLVSKFGFEVQNRSCGSTTGQMEWDEGVLPERNTQS